MTHNRQITDCLHLVALIQEKVRSTHPVSRGLIENTLRDVPQRRCKQRIDVKVFAHGMDPMLPASIQPLENSPVANGYQHLFDTEDPDADEPPSPFFVVEVQVGGKTKLHLYCDDAGHCFAWFEKGTWLIDLVRWGTQHKDPRRLAELSLAREVVNGLVRGGHFRKSSADVTIFCCDESGFGGDLRIQLFSEGRNPIWPYATPEDGEPDSRHRSDLFVKLDRQVLFHAKWGESDAGPIVSLYSELGHFHAPLLRWAESQ